MVALSPGRHCKMKIRNSNGRLSVTALNGCHTGLHQTFLKWPPLFVTGAGWLVSGSPACHGAGREGASQYLSGPAAPQTPNHKIVGTNMVRRLAEKGAHVDTRDSIWSVSVYSHAYYMSFLTMGCTLRIGRGLESCKLHLHLFISCCSDPLTCAVTMLP